MWRNYLERKSFLVAAAILLNTMIAFSQQQVQTIRGVIVDQQSKKGIEQASVSIQGTSLGAVTDSSGAFVILQVPVVG